MIRGARALRQFRDEDRGSILIMSLFFLVMMLMVAGLAVDLMRAENQRTRIQSTLDRAVLAASGLDQSLDAETVVRDYFERANLTDYLTGVSVVPGKNAKAVSATANTKMNTIFMRLLGINKLNIPASGGAEESLSNIEISLVVDVSGSMGQSSSSGNTKIHELREAAKKFVYHMQCNPDDPTGAAACSVEPDSVSVSLVPYAEQVLVGEELLQQFNETNEHALSSCADFDQADFGKSAVSLTDPLKRAGSIDKRTNYRDTSANSEFVRTNNLTCRTDSYRHVVPLSNSYTALQDQIDLLRAGGYTSIDMGMKWGTALLDPAFQPAAENLSYGATPMISPAFADRPYSYTEKSTMKVVVLMTDGENTSQYVLKDAYRSGQSPIWLDPETEHLSAYNAQTNQYYHLETKNWHAAPDGGVDNNAVQMSFPELWATYNVDFYEEAFDFLPRPTTVYNNGAKNTRLDSICTAAKGQGIEVYTIGFETSTSSSLVMKNCASTDGHHFDVTGLNLSAAFESIARDIHQLRLTN
ncbi:MAG: pilus assembly protein TadG-related protein [Marinosulfonomonas sp.]